MYTEFFQYGALPIDELKGIYDAKLVILSSLVAVMASYIALDLTGRLRDKNNSKKDALLWLVGGSIAMGSGIWAMHFIGMLSFEIPGFVLQYDLFWTIFSLFVAIFASTFALLLLKKSIINVVHFIAGGLILGLAIASMHYTGMAAMLISLNIRYLPSLFILSILVAILASEAAIWFALKSNTVVLKLRNRIKILSAITMGLAICGMHYTGMAASVFTLCTPINSSTYQGMNPTILAVIIAAVTMVILGIAFFASSYKEAKNQQQFELARELGMAEIATSVLHNVGNVLNSVNVSTETILASQTTTPLTAIKKLATLFNDHKDDLPQFLTKDPRGQHVVAYLDELATCWGKEHKLALSELKEISKNVGLIKSIISTQQDIIKVGNFEQILSINELLDEAILLSGIEQKKEIQLKREYGDIKAIVVDKVKMFQVLGNLISNAKDALLDSANQNKRLTIKTKTLDDAKNIEIQISDNGIGISNSHINKIFIFGFTTKKAGHGFGLHATALAVNEMGGQISVDSKGHEMGATFKIQLPNRKPGLLKNSWEHKNDSAK